METFNQRKHNVKLQVNTVLTQHSLFLKLSIPQQKVLFLESNELNTAHTLEGYGFQRQHMYIPQMNASVYKQIHTSLPGAHVTHETVGKLLARSRTQFDVLFFDYCQTFGAKSTLDDVGLALQRGLLADHCVVAHTCSRRGQSTQALVTAESRFLIHFQSLCGLYGYSACLREVARYGQMTFVLHTLVRCQPTIGIVNLMQTIHVVEAEGEEEEQEVDAGVMSYTLPPGHVPICCPENFIDYAVMVCYSAELDDGTPTRSWYHGVVVKQSKRDSWIVDFQGEQWCEVKSAQS